MPATIPLSDLRREHTRIRTEIDEAIEESLSEDWETGRASKVLERLEERFRG